MNSDGGSAKAPDTTAKKKPYHKPQLEVYGDIETITQHIGNNGNIDSPSTPNKLRSKV